MEKPRTLSSPNNDPALRHRLQLTSLPYFLQSARLLDSVDITGLLSRLDIQEPVYGLGLIQELARHGYHLSTGTLYPLLHSMQQDGYLVSREEIVGCQVRRYYRSTPLGQETLKDAQVKLKELVSEVLEPLPEDDS